MRNLFVIAILATLAACAGTGKAGTEVKNDSATLGETYWKLTEINGQPVKDGQGMREAHIILKAKEHMVSGSGGCNEMGGSVEMLGNNRIKFSKMRSTMMACPSGMETDSQLAEALESTESYAISDSKLHLKGADQAPLAKFEAVYLQ